MWVSEREVVGGLVGLRDREYVYEMESSIMKDRRPYFRGYC
jgi:hypothetical protein